MPTTPSLEKASARAPQELKKQVASSEIRQIHTKLVELQNRLYAENKQSVLIILQGMDASGKDGLIRRVFSGLNPQGVQVHSFKEPSSQELAHDFLWRIHAQAPARGMIQVFNRSHYEDVLITRVEGLVTDEEAHQRFASINAFETLLQQAGTKLLKFYLHISEEEQRSRLDKRLHDPRRHWKYEQGDDQKAKQWPAYREVYEDVFRHCSPATSPWQLVPADQKWYRDYVVAQQLLAALQEMDPQYPTAKT